MPAATPSEVSRSTGHEDESSSLGDEEDALFSKLVCNLCLATSIEVGPVCRVLNLTNGDVGGGSDSVVGESGWTVIVRYV